MYTFTSSAIEDIDDVDYGTISVVYNNGHRYYYQVMTPDFRQDLAVVCKYGSVGSFIHESKEKGIIRLLK